MGARSGRVSDPGAVQRWHGRRRRDRGIEATRHGTVYLLGAWVAPVVLWRRLVRRGTPPSDAVAAALGLAVVFLALDLTLLVGADSGGIFWLAQIALVVTILVWDRTKRKPA
jgi:hypothetical protein